MTSAAPITRQGDGRLWATALMLSLVVNLAILALAGFTILKTQVFRKSPSVSLAAPEPPADTTVKILLDMVAASPSPTVAAPAKPRFVRTSEDQTAAAPEKSPFIGERNTQATSDRSPDLTAPPLPSQTGIDRDDLETTKSHYQDGTLGSDQPAMPQETAPAPTLPEPPTIENFTSGENVETSGTDDAQSSPPPAARLLDGASPVDVSVPKDPAEKTALKPTPPPAAAAAKPAAEPGFKGYQRKAAIVGSISRTGRSALDVVDSPLGRYQANISRAVEQEWQRNCVRHRDFITPGFLTVRFFVEPTGKVRTVQFVGTMETGEVQKGFTLSAIRDAKIPAMPAAVKKDFDKEPLELIFNFYF